VSALEPPFAPDRGAMTARIDGIPLQITEQLARLEGFDWRLAGDPDLLAIGGLGGSAIAGELTAALLADHAPRPILVCREYGWPAAVRRGALALVCSYSGGTEETLALYREAASRGVSRVALTTGGTLGAWCARDGVAAAPLPGGSPPRAALYASWVTVTHLAGALGWMEDPAAEWRAAVRLLEERRRVIGSDSPEADNPAKTLARRLAGRRVIVYSGSERMGATATRLRQQLNENAKMLGHSATAPELNHNEIVGWEAPGDAWRDTAVLVLRDPEDRPEVALRLALTGEYATRQGAEVHVITSPDGPRLARMAAQTQFADYLSLYLAVARGVDPTPIASIDEFKRRLAESAATRER
jgi:glucose/mannose-6-phosphate isomerase